MKDIVAVHSPEGALIEGVQIVYVKLPPQILSVHLADGTLVEGREFSIAFAPDICEECGHHLEVGMFPFCRGNPLRHGVPHYIRIEPYQVEIGGRTYTIDSIQTADRLEREARGRGELLAFRLFHQNPSNMDKNVFSSMDPRPKDWSTTDRRGNPYVTKAQRAGIEASAAPIVRALMGGWD